MPVNPANLEPVNPANLEPLNPAPDIANLEPYAPRSGLGEVWTGAKRGIVAGIQGAGSVLQGAGEIANVEPGIISRAGKAMEDYGKQKLAEPGMQYDPEGAHGAITNFIAKDIAPAPGGMLPLIAASAGVGAAGTAVGGPVGGIIGAGVGGGSEAYIQTYHEKYQEALAKNPGDVQGARDYAAKSAALQGGIMAGLSAIPGAGPLTSKIVGPIVGKTATQAAEAVINKRLAPEFGKKAAELTAANLAAGAGGAAGQAAIDQEAGLGEGKTPWEAAKGSVGGSLGATIGFMPLSFLHARGNVLQAGRRGKALAEGDAGVDMPAEDRTKYRDNRQSAVDAVAANINRYDKQGAANWYANAKQAIREGKPIGIGPDWMTGPHPDLFADVTGPAQRGLGGPPGSVPPAAGAAGVPPGEPPGEPQPGDTTYAQAAAANARRDARRKAAGFTPDDQGNWTAGEQVPAGEAEAAATQRDADRRAEEVKRGQLDPAMQQQIWREVRDKNGDLVEPAEAPAAAAVPPGEPPATPPAEAPPAAAPPEAPAPLPVYTGKTTLGGGKYGAAIGAGDTTIGARRQLMVDPNGGHFWGDYHEPMTRLPSGDYSVVGPEGDHAGFTPALFDSSKDARAAGEATPQDKRGPTPPPAAPPDPLHAPDAGPISRTAALAVDSGLAPDPYAPPPPEPAAPPLPEPVQTTDRSKQSRERSRPSSVAQMQRYARNPDYAYLGTGRNPDNAAPLISVAGNDPATIPEGAYGKSSFVILADGSKMPFRYAVVDARTVLASHNADGSVNGDYFATPKQGQASTITNGRHAAYLEAIKLGTNGQYLKDFAADQDHGVSPEWIAKYGKAAQLVRVYDDRENARPNMGELSNPQSNLRMSVPEQAELDARLIDVANLVPDEHGDVAGSANAGVLKQFLQALPQNEHGDLVGPGGYTKQFKERVKAALFAKAYGSSDLLNLATESDDPGIKNILNALTIAAPEFAKSAHGGPIDLRPALIEAANILREGKARGQTQLDTAAQHDLQGRDPLSQSLLSFMAHSSRSPKKMAGAFTEAARFLQNEQASKTGDIFGKGAATRADLAARLNAHLEQEYGPEPLKFAAEKRPPYGAEEPAERAAPSRSGGVAALPGHGREPGEEQRAAPGKGKPIEFSYTPSKIVSPEERVIEERFGKALAARGVEGIAEDYAKLKDSENGLVLNTDTARELDPYYLKDRTQANAVHEPSSGAIKMLYAHDLAKPVPPGKLPLVLFTAGGTGAGKSTGLKKIPLLVDAKKKSQIVYDTNMNKFGSAKDKIDDALAAGKKVLIVYTLADPVQAFRNVVSRMNSQKFDFGSGRTLRLSTHLETHVGSLETIKQLAEHYKDNPKVEIRFVDNMRGKNDQRLISLADLPEKFDNKADEKLLEQLEKEHAAGRVTEREYTAFLGERKPGVRLEAGSRRDSGGDREQLASREASSPHAVTAAYTEALKTSPYELTPEHGRQLVRLAADAAEHLPAFEQTAREVVDSVPGTSLLKDKAVIKGAPRAIEKVFADYKGYPTQIKDLLRTTIIAPTLDEVPATIAGIGEKFGPVPYWGKMRNNLDPAVLAPEPGTPAWEKWDGYRDVLYNVEFDGVKAEIQVNLPEMMAVKKKYHVEYAARDKIIRQADIEHRKMTPEENAQVQKYNAIMRGGYDPVWDSLLTKARKSASEMGGQPLLTSESIGKNLPGSYGAQAVAPKPSGSSVTATPSTSQKEVPLGKESGKKEGLGIGGGVGVKESIPKFDTSIKVDREHPDIKALAGERNNMAAFTDDSTTVPIDRLISTKDESDDPRVLAGTKRDPRLTAAIFMMKAINGEEKARKPLTVEPRPGGKYQVIDGNATVQAARLAGWTKIPVDITEPPGVAAEAEAPYGPIPEREIPPLYFTKTRVPVEVYIADEDKTETVHMPAKKALADVREEISNYQKLLDCVQGAA